VQRGETRGRKREGACTSPFTGYGRRWISSLRLVPSLVESGIMATIIQVTLDLRDHDDCNDDARLRGHFGSTLVIDVVDR
jgi:hypothetical protein